MEKQNKNFCHDCKKEMEIEGEEIKNGVFLAYENNGETINIFKCNDCFAKDKSLTNFQPCEVYSRVVGYIRPVGQWHKGKQQEYKEREEFKNPDEGCCDCC
jgi:hypothetical protein